MALAGLPRTRYVDAAYPDLGQALRGPVGRTLLGGDPDAIVDVLAMTSAKLPGRNETAWLCATARPLPCAVVVSASMGNRRWNNESQRYDEIDRIRFAAPGPTSPGGIAIACVRAHGDLEFRPFGIYIDRAMWFAEGVSADHPPTVIRGEPTMPPGATQLRRSEQVIGGERHMTIRERRDLPTGTRRGVVDGVRARVAYVIGRRLHAPNNGHTSPDTFSGELEYVVTRETLRAYEAATFGQALELVPDHAAALREHLPRHDFDHRRRA